MRVPVLARGRFIAAFTIGFRQENLLSPPTVICAIKFWSSFFLWYDDNHSTSTFTELPVEARVAHRYGPRDHHYGASLERFARWRRALSGGGGLSLE